MTRHIVLDRTGFALLEVIIAAGLLIAVAAGASGLIAMSVRQGLASRARTVATVLAAGKLEQLRSLSWAHVTVGDPPISFPLSDVTTDLSRDPATDGGPGLLASPPGTLDGNTTPYVEYLDGTGAWAGTGASPPPRAIYVRRWMIQPLASDPDNVLALQVFVATRNGSTAVRLATLKARR